MSDSATIDMIADRLPPVGHIGEADHLAVIDALRRRAREATEDRAAWDGLVDLSMTYYAWGTDHEPGPGEVIVNDIQNEIVASCATQTRDLGAPSIEPATPDDRPEYYWAGPAWVGQAIGLPPECCGPMLPPEIAAAAQLAGVQPGPEAYLPPAPLDPFVGDQLADFAAAEPTLPIPSPLPILGPVRMKEDWVATVDNATVAKVLKADFDRKWKLAGTDQLVRRVALATSIKGFTDWVYFWDDARNLPVVLPVPSTQAYHDPMAETIRDAQFYGVDLVLDAHLAKRLMPAIAWAVDEYARAGVPAQPGGDSVVAWGKAADRNFHRPVVTVSLFWLRNQPMPLTPEEALAGGHVVHGEVPLDAPEEHAAAEELVGMMPGEDDVDSAEGESVESSPGSARRHEGEPDEQGETVGGGTGGDGADEHGRQVGDGAAGGDNADAAGGSGEDEISVGGPGPDQEGRLAPRLPRTTRPALLHPHTNEELTPFVHDDDGRARIHPQWPTRLGIRQLTVIMNEVVDDRECEHYDIPALPDVNIPVPDGRYGLGEPVRLRSIQDANSRVTDAMVENADNYRCPLRVIPQSVYDLLGPEIKQHGFSTTEAFIVVPDDLMPPGMKSEPVQVSQPPPLPAGHVQLQPMLSNLIAKQSGHTEVLQGSTPGDLSGTAIESLQSAATGTIWFKGQGMSDWIERYAWLTLHCQVHRQTPQQLAAVVPQYAPHIVAAIHRRARTMGWDVHASPNVGGSAAKNQAHARDVENLKMGALDLQSYQERSDIDPRVVERRKQVEARKQQAMAASAMAPAAAGGGAGPGSPATGG